MSSASSPSSSAGNAQDLIPVVIILGPTAVGKTEASIQLAERFDGEIVSTDSRLFYRGMDIGTAKPSVEERSRVRHHLIDVADPNETWSLGIFQNEAHKAIQDIYTRHKLPFLVGGTGQFIRAVIEGWSVPSVEPNPRLRQVLTEWGEAIGPLPLHNRLEILDPQASRAIDPSNVRRTIRALEVIFTTGRPFSAQRLQGKMLYNPLLLGLTCPRSELYQRVDERIMKMIDDGLIDEVKRLLDLGYPPGLPTLSAIGYREIVAYLQNDISLEEAIRLIKRRTRIFVRRQANWFREKDPNIHWFRTGKGTTNEMGELIQKWLISIQWNKPG